MIRVSVYIGLLISIIMYPAIGFGGGISIKSSQAFSAYHGSSKHGNYGKHINTIYRHKHFLKHRSPKRWSPRLINYYYPGLGIWTQDYNNRRSITIEQINIIISPNSQSDNPKRPSEKKEPPPPHIETINGEENTSSLNKEAVTYYGDTRDYVILYGQEKP